MALINLTKKLERMDRVYKTRPVKRNWQRIWVISAILIVAIILPGFFIVTGAKNATNHAKGLVAAYQAQNFGQIKQQLKAAKNSLGQVDLALNFLFWIRIIPILGGYYSDIKGFSQAGVLVLGAADKLTDSLDDEELGFSGQPRSGQDRVSQLILILEKSLPYLDKIEGDLKKASDSVKNIDSDKYPEINIGGVSLRKSLATAKNFIMGTGIAVSEGREALNIAPSAMGQPQAKTYLLLFQNDKEIRPTGGFITAFAQLKIDRGQIQTTTSDDIYRLDERLLATCETKICPLTPPAPIVKYLPEVSGKERSAWSMRDSNISPNLPTSAKEFERIFQLLGQGLPFDGIIYIDSQVVEELIEVTGPIDVLGTKYSAEVDKRCNCPNVIYELESYAEIAAKGEQDRKAILGVLMQQILARSVGGDIEKIPELIETIARLSNHKHVLFYMHDSAAQNALSKLNWTGEIKDYDGDYLHINDSNFAGGKSNLYVEQTVTQEISTKNDMVRKKITIEYKNPQPFGVWLNGINRDYVRFYVPKGAKLITGKGAEESVRQIENELEKSVFETFITVRPQNSRKLEIEYIVPYQPKDEYKLLIQKQPGAKDFKYKIKLNGKQVEDFKLEADKEFKFDI